MAGSKLPIAAFLVIFVSARYSEAVCCGLGHVGYCRDCSKTSVLGGNQKCCGIGSGHGAGCNMFCCSCGRCRSGNPNIKHITGWWVNARYSCTQHPHGRDNDFRNDVTRTREYFNTLDTDRDNSLSPQEFTDALREHMNMDFESSYSLAGELMNNEEEENAIPLLDAAQSAEEEDEEEAKDITAMIRREFMEMDANGDGRIQANEFDRDL